MADLLSDADVGFKASPALLSDADVGFKSAPAAASTSLPVVDDYGRVVDGSVLGQSPPAASNVTGQSAAAPAAAPSAPLPSVDDYGRDVTQTQPGQDAVNTVASRVGNAVLQGWRNTPDLLTPEAQQWIAKVDQNNPRPNLQDIMTVGHAVLAGGNAVFQGGLAGIAALGEATGQPQLGRDVAGYLEAGGMTGAPPVPGVMRSTLSETRAFLTERALATRTPAASDAIASIGQASDVDGAIAAAGRAIETPTTPSPVIADLFGEPAAEPAVPETPPAEAPSAPETPQPAGADITAPALVPEMTPAQTATALQKMVNQSAEDRLAPGNRDDFTYVPGVERPEAMRDFSQAEPREPSTALEHKTLYNTDANYHDQFDTLVKKNNAVMVDKLGDLFGDANAREAAMNEAKDLMPGSIGLFDDESVVDAQPIVDKIHEILAGPAGKRGSVESTLNTILPKLYDADNNLEVLPSMLKGVRDDITDRLYDKSPTTEGNAARTARNQLNQVLDVVDDTIASGLPGTKYQDYLSNLSAALGQVSKLDYLQKFLTGPRKLTDLAGNLQFGKVQKMLEDIQAHYGDRTGGAKELSADEINQIEAVRNELAAKDLLDRRAAVRGSPTAQLTNASGILGSGPLGTGVRAAGEMALHGALAATTHGVGNAALGAYRLIAKPMMAAAEARKVAAELEATKQRLLDTTPRNPEVGAPVPPAPVAPAAAAPATAPVPADVVPVGAQLQREQAAVAALERLRAAVAAGTADKNDPMIARVLRAAYGDDFNGVMSHVKLTGLLANFANELQRRPGPIVRTPDKTAERQ